MGYLRYVRIIGTTLARQLIVLNITTSRIMHIYIYF